MLIHVLLKIEEFRGNGSEDTDYSSTVGPQTEIVVKSP